MKQKQQYVAPAILRQTALSPGVALLAESIVEKTTVTTMGQEVDEFTAGTDFDHEQGARPSIIRIKVGK